MLNFNVKKYAAVLCHLRFKESWYHLGFVYLGLVYVYHTIRPPAIVIGISLFLGSLYLAGGYSYNALCDVRQRDRSIFFIPILLLSLFTLMSFFFIKWYVLFFAVGLLFNVFYSHQHFYWKRNFLFAILLNGYVFGILFLFGCFMSGKSLSIDSVLLTCFFIVVMFLYQLIHMMAHFDEDSVVYRVQTVKTYLRILYMCVVLFYGMTAIVLLHVPLGLLFLVSSLLFGGAFFAAAQKLMRQKNMIVHCAKDMRRIMRYVGMLYGIVLCCVFLTN